MTHNSWLLVYLIWIVEFKLIVVFLEMIVSCRRRRSRLTFPSYFPFFFFPCFFRFFLRISFFCFFCFIHRRLWRLFSNDFWSEFRNIYYLFSWLSKPKNTYISVNFYLFFPGNIIYLLNMLEELVVTLLVVFYG